MKNWDERTTNQILLDLKQLEAEHESIKMKMMKLLDEMESVERDFLEGNKALNKRLGK